MSRPSGMRLSVAGRLSQPGLAYHGSSMMSVASHRSDRHRSTTSTAAKGIRVAGDPGDRPGDHGAAGQAVSIRSADDAPPPSCGPDGRATIPLTLSLRPRDGKHARIALFDNLVHAGAQAYVSVQPRHLGRGRLRRSGKKPSIGCLSRTLRPARGVAAGPPPSVKASTSSPWRSLRRWTLVRCPRGGDREYHARFRQ